MAAALILAAFAMVFAMALFRKLFQRSHFAHLRGPSSPSWLYGERVPLMTLEWPVLNLNRAYVRDISREQCWRSSIQVDA